MPSTFGPIEADYEPDFNAWKASPTPQTASKLLTTLQPVIDRGITVHAGRQVSPVLRSSARRLALGAVKSYDPQRGTRLSTHVINHLQGLRRASRQQSQVLATPERVSMDGAYLAQTENELLDELGRDPTLQELADRTGLSVKRISHVRKFKQPVAEGSLLALAGNEEGGGGYMPAVAQDPSEIYLEAVYGDLDPVNQKILEWTVGLHSNRPLSNQQIAAKLRLTPGAVSQRKAHIQRKLEEAQALELF